MNKKINITIVLDGSEISQEIEQEFFNDIQSYQEEDIRMWNQKKYINFVGFILKENHILISFPKHFYQENLENEFSKEDFQLLLATIIKAAQNGLKDLSNSQNNFPLSAFATIYNYYKQFGLYYEEKKQLKDGYYGKINWRKTIQSVTPLEYQGQWMYMPLKIEKQNPYDTFITRCMAYVINDVSQKLNFLFSIEPIEYAFNPQEFSNKDYVLNCLYDLRQTMFKDIHLQLIDALINYFKTEGNTSGDILLKIHHFDKIWEKLVHHQLKSFDQIIDDQLRFDGKHRLFEEQKTFYPDCRHPKTSDSKNHRLEIDHYFEDENRGIRYIFDSKYYKNKVGIDYKQISYYFLLKNYFEKLGNESKTQIALILPSEKEVGYTEIEFELDGNYNNQDKGLKLYHYYLPIKEAMRSYIGK